MMINDNVLHWYMIMSRPKVRPYYGKCKFEEISDTVQEYLLARVILGEFVCKKQLADFILVI